MNQSTLILLAVGALGAVIAKWARLPSPYLLGPMIATAALSLVQSNPITPPDWLRSMGLLLLAVQIGTSVNRQAFARLGRALPIAALLIVCSITASLGLGWLIHTRLPEGFSPMTVVLGVMPGGASGLAAAAGELGAESALVGAMHSVRLFIVVIALPTLLPWFVRWDRRRRKRTRPTP